MDDIQQAIKEFESQLLQAKENHRKCLAEYDDKNSHLWRGNVNRLVSCIEYLKGLAAVPAEPSEAKEPVITELNKYNFTHDVIADIRNKLTPIRTYLGIHCYDIIPQSDSINEKLRATSLESFGYIVELLNQLSKVEPSEGDVWEEAVEEYRLKGEHWLSDYETNGFIAYLKSNYKLKK